MRSWRFWILVCISCFSSAYSAQLTQISISQQSGKTSLYFTIKGSFTYKLFSLNSPDRVVLDLNDTALGVSLNQIHFPKEVIQQIRSGSSNAKNLRLVLDVKQKVQLISSVWHPQGANGIRVDLLPLPTNHSSSIPAYRGSSAVPKDPHSIKISPGYREQIAASKRAGRYPLRDVVVVLDAGHGGKDPGAKGPGHSQEKNVVLTITLKLKQLIDKQPGMRAVLTRKGDYYVGLRNRLDIARKYNGDLFVSIHADAFNNPHSNGASVFALSQSGATSEAARWIAEKENYSELGGVNLGDLDDYNGVVRSVLIDLSQTATINSSLKMGSFVLRQLDTFTNLHNNKVEQARFMVLKSPDIPSILVETGFISNPREEKNLTSSAYQARLSQAIFQGIKGFFWENPPHGTRIEAMATKSLMAAK